MKIARVKGNIVSTVKHGLFTGKPLLLVEFLDAELNGAGKEYVAFDAAGCQKGDVVLVDCDGLAAKTMFGQAEMVGDMTICGIVDTVTLDGAERKMV